MSSSNTTRLRKGVTTGLTAAGAARAATTKLLCGTDLDTVEVFSTTGLSFTLTIAETVSEGEWVKCGIVKDAGDDPDVTNGMMVYCAVRRTSSGAVTIDGGEGIGRVTKPGLKAAVGEAAINPVPRAMIGSAIQAVCEECDYFGGVEAVISIPGGEEVAKRTLNSRLGVIGGLSILGTTGVVEPMSDAAMVDTIKAEIDVQIASGSTELLVMPGNYGRDFARDVLGLDVDEAIRCSNYIGDTLDYAVLRYLETKDSRGIVDAVSADTNVSDLSPAVSASLSSSTQRDLSMRLIGHAGKLVKLAGGIMNTHSSYADCRMEIIAAHAAKFACDSELISELLQCATTEAAIELLLEAGINDDVWQSIGERIAFYLGSRVRHQLQIEFTVFTQEHGVLVDGSVSREQGVLVDSSVSRERDVLVDGSVSREQGT